MIEPSILKPILDKWSIRFGELNDVDEKSFLLNNPIWTKPLIKINEKTYFLPVITIVQSHIIELLEALFKDMPSTKEKYYKRRALFLEDESERLFKSAFPTATILRNVSWTDTTNGGKLYENDLIILLDSVAFLVEAKSGKISPSALRGGEKGVKHVLKDIVSHPSEQSERFANYLIQNRKKHDFKTKTGQSISIDTTNISRIIRISVTLELLPLFSRWHELAESDLIKKEILPTVTIMITDLEDVFEILETPYEKIHYLMKRYEFEKKIDFNGDEIDLLAYYIESGFNDSFLKSKDMSIFGIGKSEMLNDYFMKAPYGISTKKPKLSISKWWIDILNTAISRNMPCWTFVSYIMLCLSYNEQSNFRNMHKGQVKRVKKYGHIKGTQNVIETKTSSNDMIVSFCHKNLSILERDEIVQNACGEIFDETNVDSIVVIGSNVERKDYPYSFLCLSNRNSNKVIVL